MEKQGKKFNKNVTSKEVAKLAGVSQSSVSRTFNAPNGREVKDSIRDKVLKAADELGYRPNLFASGMSSGKTNMIGLVVGDNLGPFYISIINKFIEQMQEQGKQCLVFKVPRQDDFSSVIERVIQYQVEGVIITASAMTKHMAQTVANNNIPVVLFNRFIPGLDVNMIYSDAVEGGRLAAVHLLEKNCKDICYVAFENDIGEEIEKKVGFYAQLRRAGIVNAKEEQVTAYSYDAGVEIGRKILQKSPIPEGIFCTSDMVALGIMDVAKFEFGLKIPQDLLIMGYDDIEMSSWDSYQLSTIKQPVEQLIDKTVKIILENVMDTEQGSKIEMLQPELVIRKTT